MPICCTKILYIKH